jgi:hypothetical protein
MKIFKMFHPHILDGAIVQEIGTLHGVQRGLEVNAHINSIDMNDQKVGVNGKPKDVVAFETIEEVEAYITFNLDELIDQVFT